MPTIQPPASQILALETKNGSGIAAPRPCRPRAWRKWIFLKPLGLRDETGSEIVEFGLVILPLMAFVFLIMDISWVCFAQESLQYAVQAGVRSAITSYIPAGVTGQDGYIKSIIQKNAMGFLRGADGLNKITIDYYSPLKLKKLTGNGSNAGGNIIEVSVQGASVSLLGPILIDGWTSVALNADSSDVMESSPNGIPPIR